MFPSGASSGQEHLSCSSRAFVCREAEVEGFDQLGILKANIFKMEVEKRTPISLVGGLEHEFYFPQ